MLQDTICFFFCFRMSVPIPLLYSKKKLNVCGTFVQREQRCSRNVNKIILFVSAHYDSC